VNVSYKREVLKQVGLQDETLFRGEDVDFNWRVKLLGFEIYYTPDIRVIHHHRPSIIKFWNQSYWYGRAYSRVRSKWRDMYCVYPHQFKSLKDLLKLGYFFVAILYEPTQFALRMSNWSDRIPTFFILWINQWVWKYGMLQQAIVDLKRR
jgi:GT2 family glycosyltransferase